MPPIKLVFFDMEGVLFRRAVQPGDTVVAPSVWVSIAKRLGTKAYEKERLTQERWNADGYCNYMEWMADTIKIHVEHGLTKRVFTEVMDSVQLMPGAEKTFAQLNRAGVVSAIVSGGFKHQADRAAIALKIKHTFVACEYHWDTDGFLAHWNLLPCDFRGKVDFMNLLIREYGIRNSECAFVGDGDNDIQLAETVGVSIAFNGSPNLQRVCTFSICQSEGMEDLSSILEHIPVK